MSRQRARTFQEPYRTSGVMAFNLIGRRLRQWGWKRRLKVAEILNTARRITRLTDWGDERFLEPLHVIVDALEEEADLHPFGRLALKWGLAHFVANRLAVREYLKKHPEALEEPVSRPLFVIGLPRTGTTLLYNLLCQDAARRAPRFWEALCPAPFTDNAVGQWDRRLTVARAIVTSMNYWMAPHLRAVHPFHVNSPEEDTNLLQNTFVCPAFYLYGHIPRYVEWMRGRGRELLPWVYKEYRTYLQILQHQGRRAPWILKSPAHSFALDTLLRVFPDACVVETHRDMKQVVPSTCSLFAIFQGIYSDHVDCRRLGPEIARLLGILCETADADQKREPSRVFSIAYRDLVADPLGTVAASYRYFGLRLDEMQELRMRTWLARNPAHKHGVHKYDLEQFGLTAQELERLLPPSRSGQPA